ncbi:unnamed protein product [Dovyalis caffra]|uniref:Uncharacterized protein n=1 Tax=Dovyalis caffra TaxID=77055 RepID=A0AAV1RWX0_9ROSI|nr:unnamed protein product [Dovyalis caffra]
MRLRVVKKISVGFGVVDGVWVSRSIYRAWTLELSSTPAKKLVQIPSKESTRPGCRDMSSIKHGQRLDSA